MPQDLPIQPGQIALANKLHYLAVLLGQPGPVLLGPHLAPEDDQDMPGEGLPQRDDDLVARGQADLPMKFEVGLAGLHPVVVRHLAAHLDDQILKRIQRFRMRPQMGDRIGQGEAFQRQAGRADPIDLEIVEIHDMGAAMRRDVENSLGLQHLQRLSDRHPADVELPGQVRFDEPLAELDRASGDRIDDEVGDLRGKALGPGQRGPLTGGTPDRHNAGSRIRAGSKLLFHWSIMYISPRSGEISRRLAG